MVTAMFSLALWRLHLKNGDHPLFKKEMSNSGTASIWAVGITGEKLPDKLTLKFQTTPLESNMEPKILQVPKKNNIFIHLPASHFQVLCVVKLSGCFASKSRSKTRVSLMETAIFTWMTCDRC